MLELSDYPDTGQVRIYHIEAISLPIGNGKLKLDTGVQKLDTLI